MTSDCFSDFYFVFYSYTRWFNFWYVSKPAIFSMSSGFFFSCDYQTRVLLFKPEMRNTWIQAFPRVNGPKWTQSSPARIWARLSILLFFLTPAEIIYEINRWLKVERFYIEKEASRGMKTPIRIAEVSYSIDSIQTQAMKLCWNIYSFVKTYRRNSCVNRNKIYTNCFITKI